jgi:hypothetical protein
MGTVAVVSPCYCDMELLHTVDSTSVIYNHYKSALPFSSPRLHVGHLGSTPCSVVIP